MFRKLKNILMENQGIKHTVLKNTIWLFLGEIIGRFLKLFLVVYAARILGTRDWGVFSYVFSFAAIFSIFSDIGINSLVTREIAKNKSDKLQYLSTLFIIKLLLIIISVTSLIIFTPYVSKIPEANNLIFITALLLIFDSLREFGLSLNRAQEKMEWEAFVKILTNVSVSIIGLFCVFYFPSVKNLIYTYLIGSVLGFIAIFYILRKQLKNSTRYFSKSLVKPIFNYAWPFAILTFIGTIMVNTDLLMLGWLKGPEDVGIYSVAQRLTQFLYIIPGLLSIALFPSFSKLAEENDKRFAGIFTKIIRLLLLFGFPLVIGGMILSKEIVTLIFGNAYASAGTAFAVLLLMPLINFPAIIMDNAILAFNQQRRFLKYSLLAVILNVFLNYLLIPRHSFNGSAVATVISSALGTGLVFYSFIKVNNFNVPLRMGKIIFATTIMVIVALLLKYIAVSIFLTIAISMIMYIALLYILKDHTLIEILPKNLLRE